MHVFKLLLHPIKSCRGTSVARADYDHNGFLLDRRWLIVESRTLKFQTARNLPQMVLIQTEIDEATQELVIRIPDREHPDQLEELRTPIYPDTEDLELIEGLKIWGSSTDGWAIDTEIDSALSQFLGKPVMLILKGPGHRETGNDATYDTVAYEQKGTRFQDFYPILTCTTASLAGSQKAIRDAVTGDTLDLSEEEKARWTEERCRVAIERWRPNIIIEGPVAPFDEDGWEGYSVGSSKQVIYTVARCMRCMLPNVDPATGVRDPAIPWNVMQSFRVKEPDVNSSYCFGMHSVPALASGTIAVGDEVVVTRRHPDPEARRQALH